MKRLRNVLKWIGIFLGVLVVVYLLGPTPALPTFADKMPDIKGSPADIAKNLAERENKVPRLKKDNEARIIWANDTVQEPTEFCIVYLHGFFASYREGVPAIHNLIKHYKANFVCNRMPGHGVDDKDAMLATSPESMWASAQEALAIGQKIGKKIILVGTSTGGSLALLLASKYPKLMSAVVIYSPLIDFYQKEIWLLYKPWGLQIANLLNGSPYLQQNYAPKVRPYWTTEYRVEGAIALTNLIANTMHYKTFEKVKTPIFVGTYYKDEAHQDMVISVKAMRGMFEQLGTEVGKKKIVFFPESGHHVISSDLRSKNIGKVSDATIAFLKTVFP